MALETGTHIDDLVATNPSRTDGIGTTDDHLRLIKAVLKASFPGLDDALLSSAGNVLSGKIPNLPASKITSGTFSASRLPTTPISKGGTGQSTAPAAYDALAAGRQVLAWVTFDGTLDTITAIDGYNIASITDVGTGIYTVTFDSALPNANYVMTGSVMTKSVGGGYALGFDLNHPAAVGSCRIRVFRSEDGNVEDVPYVAVVFIGG